MFGKTGVEVKANNWRVKYRNFSSITEEKLTVVPHQYVLQASWAQSSFRSLRTLVVTLAQRQHHFWQGMTRSIPLFEIGGILIVLESGRARELYSKKKNLTNDASVKNFYI